MNPVIDNNDRRLPYELSEERFEALHDRIRGQIARRAAAGIVTAHRLRQPVAAEPGIEGLLSTASAETLQQAAAENYDDIFYNQQL